MSSGSNSDSSSETGSDHGSVDDWDEADAEETECLFCNELLQSAFEVIRHQIQSHDFDIVAVCKQCGFDMYGYIRLINYFRRHGDNAEILQSKKFDAAAILADDSLLRPVLDNDPLLWALDDADLAPSVAAPSVSAAPTAIPADLSQQMSEMMQLLRDDAMGVDARASVSSAVRQEAKSHENLYFGSYDAIDIHETMLKDTVRTEAYRDAMYRNSAFFRDKIVLDIGCGTGILSLFAAKAGAKKVFAIEATNMAEIARRNIARNGYSEVIQVLQGLSEDIELPVEKVDIIVSEWMGYFLIYEAMLDSVLRARDKWLAPGGLVLPDRSQIFIAGTNVTSHDDSTAFWKDVYGFDFSAVYESAGKRKKCEAVVETVPASGVCTSAAVILDIDIVTMQQSTQTFSSSSQLSVAKAGKITGFVTWFDCIFGRMAEAVVLPTGPATTTTHWEQTVFTLPAALDVSEGDQICVKMACQPSRENKRHLDITLEWSCGAQQGKQRYFMD
eukprot:TRINITY_DN11409_c1_g1_i2.p1 TRINITY_DN11409_c1_g1~~TRINITY_DN11409_c1_g1_i2.p1  ORF type:complete len:501 (+),score=111.49 TRINITY_DN11409_c1_g1_i2:44-1546(+)